MRLAIVHNLPSGGALRAASAQLALLATHHDLALYTLSTAEAHFADFSFISSRTVFPFAPSPVLTRPFGMFDPLVRLADLQRLDRVYAEMARAIDATAPDAVLVLPCLFTQAPRVLAHLKTPTVYFCHEPPRALYEPAPDAQAFALTAAPPAETPSAPTSETEAAPPAPTTGARNAPPIEANTVPVPPRQIGATTVPNAPDPIAATSVQTASAPIGAAGEPLVDAPTSPATRAPTGASPAATVAPPVAAPAVGPQRALTVVERLRELRHRPFAALLRARKIALDREACRAASVVAVSSHFIAAAVQRIYARTPEIAPLGVDSARFVPGDGPRGDHVLAVGALSPWKGFDLAIAALAQLTASERPALIVVSDRAEGGYADALHAQAAAGGVTLTLRARISDAELVALYQTARVTLCTPVREPFGLVPLESMACATAVIGVGEGGIPESIEHGVTGLVVSREPSAVAAALRDVLRGPALAEAMGQAGRAAVLARWTWSASAERLLELLANARNSGHRSAGR